MGVDHLGGNEGLRQEFGRLWRELRRVAKATLQNGSIGRAGLRVYDGGWIRIEGGGLAVTGTQTVSGSLNVSGTERVTGTLTVSGTLDGNGNIDWTGPSIWRGTVNVTGNMATSGTLTIGGATTVNGTLNVVGASTLNGAVTLNNNLTLGTGRILAGSVTIDKNGGYGGRIAAPTLLLDTSHILATGSLTTSGGITAATGNIVASTGDVYGNNKYFRIPHPSKPHKNLVHGSLEGPEHGVYYRGVVAFDEGGEAVFALPDYFVSLVLTDDDPTVQVTAQGRPFMTGYEPVADGRVTIYGDPGRKASVTVTAARGRFEVEPDLSEA